MISDRTQALLSAATAIYAGVLANPSSAETDSPLVSALRGKCVADAYALLDAIEAREKANAPKTVAYCKCDTVHGDNHLCPIHGG